MSRSAAADEIILSYDDAVLRQSDLRILSGPRFLNDRIIEFYFSYLSSSSSSFPSEDVLLVPPSITFWISNCPDADSLSEFAQPLKLPERKIVLFPVNDNDDVEVAEGGSHWSLLAYHSGRNVFVHHDSLGGMNKRPARRLYSVLAKLMGKDAAAAEYREHADSPLQQNGYDCGLFVIATARAICSWYDEHLKRTGLNGDVAAGEEELWFSAVKEQVTKESAGKLRSEIRDLITSLMERRKN
ncbi:unnamed protein product [Linum tenue]|uniref:Ubiquitin-like protease family profile domain-containing protein n=1 Tax=Linum tenue TaxID=586396 RepID=A0AAV0QK09_9ROSI|nr:unnamed protein product [Linum tenue]